MHSTVFDRRIDRRSASEVWAGITDFGRYPEHSDAVRSVQVTPTGTDGRSESHWRVDFRNGILEWRELDVTDPASSTIEFEQIDGDFDTFRGRWSVRPGGDGCDLRFEVTFDFGVPSLASIIDPVAVRVLTETIDAVLAGMFPGSVQPPTSVVESARRAVVPG